jgi:dolichyl-phosphate-mannose--protein O-mannosyl transferase
MYLNRTVFQFYTIAFEPYLILGLTFTVGVILGKFPVFNSGPKSVTERRDQRPLVAVFLVGATLISAFFYPLWAGIQTSFPFWQVHMWLQSWV